MLVFLVFIDHYANRVQLLAWTVVVGLSLVFSYFIKEDGIWELLLTGLVIAACLMCIVARELGALIAKPALPVTSRSGWLHVAAVAAILVLPLGIFAGSLSLYEQVNYHYFGVKAINTRTGGQYGLYIQNLMRIDAPGRSSVVWTPFAAVEASFDVSPSLRAIPDLERNILNSPWFQPGAPGYYHGEPAGDFVGWALRDAWIASTGNWDEVSVEETFAKVNAEIAQAFRDGQLSKAPVIQLTSSMGGLTLKQIAGLAPVVWAGLRVNIGFAGLSYVFHPGDCANPAMCTLADNLTSMNLQDNGGGLHIASVCNTVIRLYQLFGPLLMASALIGLLIEIVAAAKHRSSGRQVVIVISSFILLGAGLAVVFAIAWFCQYVAQMGQTGLTQLWLMAFYSVEATPLIFTGEMLGMYLLARRAADRWTHRAHHCSIS
jgi:hypothetical protein